MPCSPRFHATAQITNATPIAPANAPSATSGPVAPSTSRHTSAPRLAPPEMPRMSGLASGLCRSDWKVAPAIANPTPASSAAAMRGARRPSTMSCSPGSPPPNRVATTRVAGRLVAPSSNAVNARPTTPATQRPATRMARCRAPARRADRRRAGTCPSALHPVPPATLRQPAISPPPHPRHPPTARNRDEDGRAEKRGDHACFQFRIRHDQPSDGVGTEQKCRAKHEREGTNPSIVVPDKPPGRVGHDQCDEGKRPGERGCHAAEQNEGYPGDSVGEPNPLTQRAGNIVTESEQVQPVHHPECKQNAENSERPHCTHGAQVTTGERPHCPESVLVEGVGVAQQDESDKGGEQRRERRARQRYAGRLPAPNRKYEGCRNRRSHERKPDVPGRRGDAAERNCHDDRERGSRAHAEQSRIRERIAAHSLAEGARQTENSPGDDANNGPRHPQAGHNLLPGVRSVGVGECLPDGYRAHGAGAKQQACGDGGTEREYAHRTHHYSASSWCRA